MPRHSQRSPRPPEPPPEKVTRNYKVTGSLGYKHLKPGEVGELTLTEEQEQRALDRCAIERVPEPFTAPVSSALKPRSKNRPEKAVTTEEE